MSQFIYYSPLILLGVICVVLLSLIIFSKEFAFLLGFMVFPLKTRNKSLRKYVNAKDQVVYILGTIRSKHLSEEKYSLMHIEAIIANLAPELLLIESKLEKIANEELVDGTIEMLYAYFIAKEEGVRVKGIDWRKKTVEFRKSSILRENKMFANLINAINNSHVSLVLTGFSHAIKFDKKMKLCGFKRIKVAKEELERLFEVRRNELYIPPKLVDYLNKKLEICEQKAKIEERPKIKEKLYAKCQKIRLLLDFFKNSRKSK